MNLKTYQQLTGRTRADLSSKAVDAAHMALGIVGEWSEACEETINLKHGWSGATKESHVKEWGDLMWYVSELANLFDIQLKDLQNIDINEGFKNVGWIAENVKKYLAYSKEIDLNHLEHALNIITTYAAYEVENIIGGYKFEDCLSMNIDKLKKRFPDKFDANMAIKQMDNDID